MTVYTIYDTKARACSDLSVFDNDLIAYRQLKSRVHKICDNYPFFKVDDFLILRIGNFNNYISSCDNIGELKLLDGSLCYELKDADMVEQLKTKTLKELERDGL